MARIDNKFVPDRLKSALEKIADERKISLNQLTIEILEDYTKNKFSFESEKKFTDTMSMITIAMNKNTEILEHYIESNNILIETNKKLIDILTD